MKSLFRHFFESQTAPSLLVKAYNYGCCPLMYDNRPQETLKTIQDIRGVLACKIPSQEKEHIYDCILKIEKDSGNITEAMSFIESLNTIMYYKGDPKGKYPKIPSTSEKSNLLDFISNELDLTFLRNNYEKIENLYLSEFEKLISLVIEQVLKSLLKFKDDSAKKMEKILNLKAENDLLNNICSITDKDRRDNLWDQLDDIISDRYYDFKSYRKDFRRVIERLKESIHKFAKKQTKKRVNSQIKKENPEDYKNLRKKEFNFIVKEILSQINEKIHQNEEVLKTFKDFFELSFMTLNVLGTDFSSENSTPNNIYRRFRKMFKVFLDLYILVNPSDDDYKYEKETESPELHGLPKLAKMQTRAPEEEKIKEFKFKSEKIGKIFQAFARKADSDLSLKNTFSLAYGSFSYFVERFVDMEYINRRKISKIYAYYIHKTPNPRSITTNLKFYYLRFK